MSLDSFLTQTCTITRPTAARVDRYNTSKYVDEPVAESVLCRQVTKQVRVLDPVKAEYAWVQMDMLLLPAGTNVQALDKLTIDGGATIRTVKDCLPRRMRTIHHITVTLEALNG